MLSQYLNQQLTLSDIDSISINLDDDAHNISPGTIRSERSFQDDRSRRQPLPSSPLKCTSLSRISDGGARRDGPDDGGGGSGGGAAYELRAVRRALAAAEAAARAARAESARLRREGASRSALTSLAEALGPNQEHCACGSRALRVGLQEAEMQVEELKAKLTQAHSQSNQNKAGMSELHSAWEEEGKRAKQLDDKNTSLLKRLSEAEQENVHLSAKLLRLEENSISLQSSLREIQSQNKVLQNENSSLKKQTSALMEENTQAQTKSVTSQAEASAQEAKIKKLEKDLSDKDKLNKRLEKSLAFGKQQIEENERKIDQLEAHNCKLAKDCASETEEAVKWKKNTKKMEQTLDEFVNEHEQLEKVLKASQKKEAELQDEMSCLGKKVEAKCKELENIENKSCKQEQKISELVYHCQQLETENLKLADQIKHLLAKEKESVSKEGELRRSHSASSQQLEACIFQKQNLDSEVVQLRETLQRADDDMKTAQKELGELEEAHSKTKEAFSESKAKCDTAIKTIETMEYAISELFVRIFNNIGCRMSGNHSNATSFIDVFLKKAQRHNEAVSDQTLDSIFEHYKCLAIDPLNERCEQLLKEMAEKDNILKGRESENINLRSELNLLNLSVQEKQEQIKAHISMNASAHDLNLQSQQNYHDALIDELKKQKTELEKLHRLGLDHKAEIAAKVSQVEGLLEERTDMKLEITQLQKTVEHKEEIFSQFKIKKESEIQVLENMKLQLSDQVENLKKEAAALQNEFSKLHEDGTFNEEKIESLSKSLLLSKTEHSKSFNQLNLLQSEASSETKRLQNQIEVLKHQEAELVVKHNKIENNLARNLDATREKLAENEDLLYETRQVLSDCQRSNEELKKELAQKSAECDHYSNLQSQLHAVISESEAFNTNKCAENAQFLYEIAQLKETNHSLDRSLVESQDKLSKTLTDVQDREKLIHKLEAELELRFLEKKANIEKKAEYSVHLNTVDKKLHEVNHHLLQTENTLEHSQNELSRVGSMVQIKQSEVSQLKDANAALQELLVGKENTISGLKAACQRFENQMQQRLHELECLEQENTNLKNRLKRSDEKLEMLQQDHTGLNESFRDQLSENKKLLNASMSMVSLNEYQDLTSSLQREKSLVDALKAKLKQTKENMEAHLNLIMAENQVKENAFHGSLHEKEAEVKSLKALINQTEAKIQEKENKLKKSFKKKQKGLEVHMKEKEQNLKSQLETLKNEKVSMEENIASMQQKNVDLELQMSEIEKQLSSLKDSLEEQIKAKDADRKISEKEKSDLITEISIYKDKLKEEESNGLCLKEKLKEIEATAKLAKATADNERQQKINIHQISQQMEKQVSQLQAQVEAKSKLANTLQEKILHLETQTSLLMHDVVVEELAQTKNLLANEREKTNHLERALVEHDVGVKEHAQIKNLLVNEQEKTDHLERFLRRQDQKYQQMKRHNSTLKTNVSDLSQKVHELKSQNQSLKAICEEKEDRVSTLMQRLESQLISSSKDQVNEDASNYNRMKALRTTERQLELSKRETKILKDKMLELQDSLNNKSAQLSMMEKRYSFLHEKHMSQKSNNQDAYLEELRKELEQKLESKSKQLKSTEYHVKLVKESMEELKKELLEKDHELRHSSDQQSQLASLLKEKEKSLDVAQENISKLYGLLDEKDQSLNTFLMSSVLKGQHSSLEKRMGGQEVHLDGALLKQKQFTSSSQQAAINTSIRISGTDEKQGRPNEYGSLGQHGGHSNMLFLSNDKTIGKQAFSPQMQRHKVNQEGTWEYNNQYG